VELELSVTAVDELVDVVDELLNVVDELLGVVGLTNSPEARLPDEGRELEAANVLDSLGRTRPDESDEETADERMVKEKEVELELELDVDVEDEVEVVPFALVVVEELVTVISRNLIAFR
jgi:hypothetical protein